jgi:DNA-binding CsgD family transcriptional regulator
MTANRLRMLRRLYRERNEIPPDLLQELRGHVQRLVYRRLLPPIYAPHGQWNEEAVDEVLQGWMEVRLVGNGQLQKLLDEAATPAAFAWLAETSLRHYLLDSKERSQAGNLFGRLVKLLDENEDGDFILVADARRSQDRAWGLSHWKSPGSFDGSDDKLASEAFALGDFNVIRYKATAKKLSPVLDHLELARFVKGLLGRVGAALTVAQMMVAIVRRFDLGEPVFTEFEEVSDELSVPADEQLELKETALALVVELTERQLEILIWTERGETIKALAKRLNCSAGTIFNDQREIGRKIDRFCVNDQERLLLLNKVLDLAFELDGTTE